jgi:hypothetical protein
MKTIKYISIFSVLVFFGLTIIFSNAAAINGSPRQTFSTRYQVNVHFNRDVSLCNLYVVKVVDESGREVAPRQLYQPEFATYYFYEKGPVSGTRTAELVPDEIPLHFICPNELYNTKEIKRGTFMAGQTYQYDLYPNTHNPNPVPPGSGAVIGHD